jgi:acyl-CoA synthetase (NDP forming)
VAVLTTAGGWGVVTADAIAASDLRLLPLPDDLRRAIGAKLPPRWSRSNPIDLAGSETRDTIPETLGLVAGHADVDAVVYLGLGIQSNQARLMRTGRFYPDHGLERIVAYHERQDERFATAAAEVSDATGKPVLTATELAVADPDNAGPRAVRTTGRVCYASSNRAVTALEHLWRYARHRARRGE